MSHTQVADLLLGPPLHSEVDCCSVPDLINTKTTITLKCRSPSVRKTLNWLRSTNPKDLSHMEQNCVDDLIDLVKALLLDTRNKTMEKVLIMV